MSRRLIANHHAVPHTSGHGGNYLLIVPVMPVARPEGFHGFVPHSCPSIVVVLFFCLLLLLILLPRVVKMNGVYCYWLIHISIYKLNLVPSQFSMRLASPPSFHTPPPGRRLACAVVLFAPSYASRALPLPYRIQMTETGAAAGAGCRCIVRRTSTVSYRHCGTIN
jgi:hypothetical protein